MIGKKTRVFTSMEETCHFLSQARCARVGWRRGKTSGVSSLRVWTAAGTSPDGTPLVETKRFLLSLHKCFCRLYFCLQLDAVVSTHWHSGLKRLDGYFSRYVQIKIILKTYFHFVVLKTRRSRYVTYVCSSQDEDDTEPHHHTLQL